MGQPHSTTEGIAGHLLEGLDAAALDVILGEARRRSLPVAHVICRTGEPAEQLVLLRSGSVRFSRLARNGREVVMGVLVAGDVCGLGSLLGPPTQYYGTAVTLEPSETLVWNHAAIKRLAVAYPVLSRNALQVALKYIAHFVDRQMRLSASTAEERLASTLIRLGTQTGNTSPAGVELAVTNDVLASLADVSPYTASRALQSWSRSGAVEKSRGRVRITCPEKLLVD